MKLYLIDGSSYVYRAYHAIRGLTDSKGRPTNAIFGFTNTLLKIIREKSPDSIAVSFDSPVPTERHRIFEHYKAHRPPTPEDLISQMPAIRKIIEAMKIKIYQIPGYEADDILATIAEKAVGQKAEVFIVTGDKDMLQLIGEKVRVYDPIKDVVLDKDYVMERFGVPPERVTEFMALTGDAADNIPGIRGIGEKTAKELLKDAGSLDELLEHPERIKKERLRKLIEENGDVARLSKKLAEIDRKVPLDVDMKELSLGEPDAGSLLKLFSEYEFSSLMKYISAGRPAEEVRCETVFSPGRLGEVLKRIKGEFSIDTEATDRDPLRAELVGISLSFEKGKAFYIPLAHRYKDAPRQMEKAEALSLIKPLVEDSEKPKIGHNLKYDILLLGKYGLSFGGLLYDTILASYLINPLRGNHGLETVALEYLARRKKTFEEISKGGLFSDVPVDEAASYACDDAETALRLREALFERLKSDGLEEVYFGIEMPLIGVLSDMEKAGIKVDADKLKNISAELEGQLESLRNRIFFLAGREFNINSPKQLGEVLFETMGLKPGKKKKTGYSTDISVLEELSKEHELPGEILGYRSLFKLKTTYVDVLPEIINPSTGRVHTSFNQSVTATGRLSSSEPNLQNIPIRGQWGRRIREAFVAEEDSCLVSADYSQIELRVLAHLSKDEGLLEAFRAGVDIHARTASEVFGVPEDSVSPEMRRAAKGINFGLIYGITQFGLSEALGVTPEEAGEYIKKYFQRHEGIKTYMDETLKSAYENGYVRTLFGRMRKLPELKAPKTRALGERLALNSPVQGTAADIIKIAMINISNALKGMRTRMLLQVHDELLLECPMEELKSVLEIVKREMEGVALPGAKEHILKVEIGWGRNWAEAH